MEKKTKVLYVITKSNFGGAQRYVYDLATALPREEFEVAVATGGEGLLVSMLREKHIPVFLIKSFQRDISVVKDFFSIFELWKLYRSFRPDVVHLNSSKAGGMGAFVARCARVPKIIFTAHGWPFWEPRNIVQKTLIAFFSWLTVVFSHTTICISESDARIGRHMPFVQNKIRMIRNGVNSYEPFTRSDARTKLFDTQTIALHTDDVWVLTLAELTKNKNLFIGIDAVCEHNAISKRKIFYSLIGDGEQKAHLAAYIAEKKADEYIRILGFVTDARRYYRGFDFFFLPSLKEGVPYVLLETGLAGLPCIASNVGGIPEIIENGVSGFLVPPRDSGAMARALARLTANKMLRETYGAALHAKVIRGFSVERMRTQTLSVYTASTGGMVDK